MIATENLNPLVSIIVPTFNRKDMLKETLDSILNQTYSNFELIVVDNYSNYDFFQSIKSLNDKRIKSFQNNNNGVIAANRNFGISLSKGEYIAFCDDDDIWEPSKLKTQIESMQKENADLSFTDIGFLMNAKGYNLLHDFQRKILSLIVNMGSKSIFLFQNVICNSTVVVRKEVLNRVGVFNESSSIVKAEDYDLWLRVIRQHKTIYVNEKLLKYRLHHAQASSTDSESFSRTKRIISSNKGFFPFLTLNMAIFFQTRAIPFFYYLKHTIKK